MDCITAGFPVLHHLSEFAQTPMSIESMMPPNYLILCCPLLLLPSLFPSIRVFSNESALRIRWAKYWSFSLSISPSNEYSGLISFRIDWFDFLAVKGLSRVFSNTTVRIRCWVSEKCVVVFLKVEIDAYYPPKVS